ncbi:MAG: molybdenum cofactor guanylyltransferase [Burkholderiales bacterium]
MRIAAVILAGGKGVRLGRVNKALIEVGGMTLLDRALAVTGDCDVRLLSVGPEDWESGDGIEHVLDLETDYGGPLAGVAAAVAHLVSAPPDILFSLAVDSPLFPRDFVARALPLLKVAPVVLASYAEQDYPTNALWRLNAIRTLADDVRRGAAPRSLKRLAEGLGAARLDYATLLPADPFRNANTPEDLEFLRREVEHLRGG